MMIDRCPMNTVDRDMTEMVSEQAGMFVHRWESTADEVMREKRWALTSVLKFYYHK